MASREEAAGAAWEGADLERPIPGENPESDSLGEARRWVSVYSHLVKLEQDLLDVLAGMIPTMPGVAGGEVSAQAGVLDQAAGGAGGPPLSVSSSGRSTALRAREVS